MDSSYQKSRMDYNYMVKPDDQDPQNVLLQDIQIIQNKLARFLNGNINLYIKTICIIEYAPDSLNNLYVALR